MDPFDFKRAADGPTESHPKLDTLLYHLSFDDFAAVQRADEFRTTVISRQSALKHGVFSEFKEGLLERKYPHDTGIVQTVVPEPLRSNLLALMHYVFLAGHPGQKKSTTV